MGKLRLRALTTLDKTKTLFWHNQEDIKDLYSGHPFPVNIEMESVWYDKILKSNFPTTVFGIELIEEEKLIGITILKNIDLIHKKAEIAIYIGDKNERGKSYAKMATYKTMKFAFHQLGLNRLVLHVITNNTPAINLYEMLGFKKEGELKESIYKNGSFNNEYIMGLLAKDFDKQHE